MREIKAQGSNKYGNTPLPFNADRENNSGCHNRNGRCFLGVALPRISPRRARRNGGSGWWGSSMGWAAADGIIVTVPWGLPTLGAETGARRIDRAVLVSVQAKAG